MSKQCEQYLQSTEVIRIVQSHNETFINRVLACIAACKETICRNVLTKHYLLPTDILQLCREDAFQEAQLILIREIQHNRFVASSPTCIPYLVRVFRNQYWQEYQKEIRRKMTIEKLTPSAHETSLDATTDYSTQKVNKLLQQLGNTDQEIYRLHYIEGMKVREIAPLLNIEASSVTKQLIRLHRRFGGLWQTTKD